jgi:hypothetical protein
MRDLTTHTSRYILRQEVHRRLTDNQIRHRTLFTIEPGHTGQRFYTTQRDAANHLHDYFYYPF